MELNVFRTAVPPCMGIKIELAMASRLVVEPPPMSAAAEAGDLSEETGDDSQEENQTKIDTEC